MWRRLLIPSMKISEAALLRGRTRDPETPQIQAAEKDYCVISTWSGPNLTKSPRLGLDLAGFKKDCVSKPLTAEFTCNAECGGAGNAETRVQAGTNTDPVFDKFRLVLRNYHHLSITFQSTNYFRAIDAYSKPAIFP
jgi:hypothetical protein